MYDNLLPIVLITTALGIPVSCFAGRLFPNADQADIRRQTILTWVYFLSVVLAIRLVAGLLALGGANLPAVSWFFPIRIAYPNYGVLQGLPYLILCLAAFAYLPRIADYIQASCCKYLLLWGFSVALLMSFGGIHGGIIAGNIGVAASTDHAFDAAINASIVETFATHVDRVLGLIEPAYRAPHSTSHPASSIVYWQVFAKNVPPVLFSFLNVVLLSLAFPVMYWALRRRTNEKNALATIFAALVVPGILIYGRSDDAVCYALAAMVIASISVALHEARYALLVVATALLAISMNASYAGINMLPAMFSFTTEARVRDSFIYLRHVLPHILLTVLLVSLCLALEARFLSYDYIAGFRATVEHNNGYTLFAWIDRGAYARAFTDRMTTIFEFLIQGGPLFVFLLVRLARGWNSSIGNWQIKNVALAVLFVVLAVYTPSAGETARVWGGLYLVMGFCWLPQLFSDLPTDLRWWLIRISFAWALMSQAVLNFSW